MKKTIFIIIGVLIIILVIGVWAYLFTYGSPKNSNDIFATFGFGKDTSVVVETDPTRVDVQNETASGLPQKLRQLTTRPVAGAVITSSDVTYVEQGTGHIYTINLNDGNETLINGTTIPQTDGAVFSADGTYVAITSYTTQGAKTIIGIAKQSQNESVDDWFTLPLNASNITFGDTETDTAYYIIKEQDGASGYTYTMSKNAGSQLFKTALRDINALWGNPMYVHTTPTSYEEGHLYKVVGNDVSYVTKGGNGLVGFRYDDGVVVTHTNDGVQDIVAISNDGREGAQSLPFIPEKCVKNPSTEHSAYCAVPTNINTGVFPDSWYKGVISYSDILWVMNIESGEVKRLSDFLTESGREIDVEKIGTNETGEYVWFINKNDNTLWMFDTTM